MHAEEAGAADLLFVAGSIVGGLALAFLIVALRPDLVRPDAPAAPAPAITAASRAAEPAAGHVSYCGCRPAGGARGGEHIYGAGWSPSASRPPRWTSCSATPGRATGSVSRTASAPG